MKKKTGLVLISVLALTLVLTMPYYVQQPAAQGDPLHYRIKLSQLCCNATVDGTLTNSTHKVIATFHIVCDKLPPDGNGFGYAEVKVTTTSAVKDINFTLVMDYNGIPPPEKTIKHSEDPITIPYTYLFSETWAVDKKERKVKLEVTQLTGALHWKIILAQKNCDAFMKGWLSNETGGPIPCTDFKLNCTCGGFVYEKVVTPECTIPHDINFTLYIDWNKDGTIDYTHEYGFIFKQWPWQFENSTLYAMQLENMTLVDLTHPECTRWNETTPVPNLKYHLQDWQDTNKTGKLDRCDYIWLNLTYPSGRWCTKQKYHVEKVVVVPGGPIRITVSQEKMVVVELYEHDYDPTERWQFTVKQENCRAVWSGWLTNKTGAPIMGSSFLVECTGTMQCKLVKIPWCTEPYDIHHELFVYNKTTGALILHEGPEDVVPLGWPFRVVKSGTGWKVELEVNEVQMHRYIVMGGQAPNCAQLNGFQPMFWNVPYASRPPDYTPLQEQALNITFTQRDPISGIVKLGVIAETMIGVNHVFYSPTSNQWYNVSTFLREQGCGWIFTGQGKDPILGDVNLIIWNNDTGTYSNKTGKLIALGPCLQKISGLDGIPGTGDPGDIFGDGTPDPPGSSILYLPAMVHADWNASSPPNKPVWLILYEASYPNVYVTAATNDTVVEPASYFHGVKASAKGQPWEFLAGLDHPEYCNTYWKHSKCNAYVTYANAWSLLNIPTAQGDLDLLWKITYKLVREDCVIADLSGDEVVNIKDIVTCAVAFGAKDEGITWTGSKWDWKAYADSNFDAKGDLMPPKGWINIKDIVKIATDFGAKLTPNCIIRP